MRGSRVVLPLLSAITVAVGCSGGSGFSPLPGPVVTVTAGDGQATLTWPDLPGTTQYFVYWATDPTITSDNYSNLPNNGRDSTNTASDVITGLTNGTTYWFVVTGVDSKGAKGKDSNRVATDPTPWVNPAQIEGAPLPGFTADALTPAIASSPNGFFQAVWSRRLIAGTAGLGRYSIHAARFDGTNWTAPLAIDSADGYSYTPRIAADHLGGAVAVWRQDQGSTGHVWSNAFAAGQWGTQPVQVDALAGAARNPAIAAVPGGGAYLAVWSQASGAANQIFASSLPSAGGAWSAPVQLMTSASDADFPQVALDGAGNGLAVWQENGGIYSAPYNAGVWGAAVSLSTNLNASAPSLAMNPVGHALAVWLEQPATVPQVVGAWYNGTAWGTPVTVDAEVTASSSPLAALDASDRAGAVWLQLEDSIHQSVLARDYTPATQWRSISLLLPDFTGNAQPPVLKSDAGSLQAVWAQQVLDPGGSGTFQNVYSARLGLATTGWDPALQVSAYGQSDSPALSISSAGEEVVVWTMLSSNGTLIRSNHLP